MQVLQIEHKIYTIRHLNIMLDFDLALLYNAETHVLKQTVKRNIERFSKRFMFELAKDEWNELITKCDKLSNNIKYSTKRPFTEQSVVILSRVLKSKKAKAINIAIMRAFVFIRQQALSHKYLSEKLNLLEEKFNKKFSDIAEALNYLLQKDKRTIQQNKRKTIGYKTK